MAVANYAPELIEFWRVAYRQEIAVELADENEAYTLRVRLYRLRKDLEKERHEAWHLAKRAMIQLRGSTLIGKPADDQYAEAMRAAGITVATENLSAPIPVPPTIGEEIVLAPSSMQEAVKDFVKSEDDP